MKKTIIALSLSLVITSSYAASLEKAKTLSEHGLKDQAKIELIDIIFSKTSDSNKAKAYYELGRVSFENNQVTQALKTWTQLSLKYPSSNEAKLVKSKIEQLSEIVGESAKESVDNAIAASYLKHADFWSSDKDSRFTIDSSWIPKVETANKWYDKTITEFPNSKAARIAYEEKIRTLLGWKERGQYGSKFGVEKDFATYMPQVLKAFKELETQFPKASTLQAFRYQIAQAYWNKKDWENTRLWLNTIITKAGDTDSFYKDTAQRRLQKVEY
ncbi:MAG: tetratricopeptide repeat protein [Colwellia sp.]|uniref:tetratricopeptide repeat protein n=1 Tax=Pseudoalteromonas sp. bablab_jr010 TaxID=2755063 RepID=UPI0018F7201E|nr:tetratricopeptide repeat protein [Pseudoalteromonas sp. bablab_jr010]